MTILLRPSIGVCATWTSGSVVIPWRKRREQAETCNSFEYAHYYTYSLIYFFIFIYLGLAECYIYDLSIGWVKGGAPSF